MKITRTYPRIVIKYEGKEVFKFYDNGDKRNKGNAILEGRTLFYKGRQIGVNVKSALKNYRNGEMTRIYKAEKVK